jgi:hypothetical protein
MRHERSVMRTSTGRAPQRLLYAAAATLAAGVVADSTAEHYRAGFHNRAMFISPIVSSTALATALSAMATPNRDRAAREGVFAASVATGILGLYFHLTNVARRPGGWNSSNVFYGAPVAAPLAVTMAGLLGLAAGRLAGAKGRSTMPLGRAVGALSAAGLLATSAEATALHFRGAFQNPFMYAPVALPPVTALTLAAASTTSSARTRTAARTLLRLTSWLGMIGAGFHAWGVHRRMGGWRNWRQNLLVGPPLPAPPAFTGLALAGLAAIRILDADGAR